MSKQSNHPVGVTLHEISNDLAAVLAKGSSDPWDPQEFEAVLEAMANLTDRLKTAVGAVNHHGAANQTNPRVQQRLHMAAEWLTLAATAQRDAQQYAKEQRTAKPKPTRKNPVL